MTLDQIRGQDRVIERLSAALARNRLPHGLIFGGPPGVGKRTTALAIAMAQLCADEPGRGCGRCLECSQVAAGTHPDLFIEDLAAARRERPAASTLSIDQIRRLRSQLALTPARGRAKVGIIEPAERLTADAQNALLKTLEEPPGHATLLLVTTAPRELLATIRSRAQTWSFGPLPDPIMKELLVEGGCAPDSASQTVRFAEGSLERAREMLDEDAVAAATALEEQLENIERTGIPDLLDLAAELAGARGAGRRDRQTAHLTAMQLWGRRRLRAAAETHSSDPGPASRATLLHARRRLGLIHATSRALERNANIELAWDRLLLELRTPREIGG